MSHRDRGPRSFGWAAGRTCSWHGRAEWPTCPWPPTGPSAPRSSWPAASPVGGRGRCERRPAPGPRRGLPRAERTTRAVVDLLGLPGRAGRRSAHAVETFRPATSRWRPQQRRLRRRGDLPVAHRGVVHHRLARLSRIASGQDRSAHRVADPTTPGASSSPRRRTVRGGSSCSSTTSWAYSGAARCFGVLGRSRRVRAPAAHRSGRAGAVHAIGADLDDDGRPDLTLVNCSENSVHLDRLVRVLQPPRRFQHEPASACPPRGPTAAFAPI